MYALRAMLLRLAPGLRKGLGGRTETAPQILRLAQWLEVSPAEVLRIRTGPRYHYRPFTIEKRDGRERRILAPTPALKQLQRRLLRGYLETLPVHHAATAYQSGHSIYDNARIHIGQAVVATLDLADFFENTHADRVRAFFKAHDWHGPALGALMALCVHRGGLPQGAPTSPCLSNLVNFELDQALMTLAQRAGGRYTRYGDDMTFSWATPRVPANFAADVFLELHRVGYTVQPRKPWHVRPRADSPRITGLELTPDGFIRAPAALRWRVYGLRFWHWLTHDARTAERLQGYAGYFRMIHDDM